VRAKEFIIENRGLPFPGTYEEEYGMFKRKGPRRIIAMTNEALDTPYSYDWDHLPNDDYNAVAELPDGSLLEIGFSEMDRGETRVDFTRNDSADVTNEGDAFRIFATVMAALKDYVDKFQPNKISFSAAKMLSRNDELVSYASRAKLYKRLVQMYASKLGYTPTVIDEPNKAWVDFTLKKIRTTEQIDEAFDTPYPYDWDYTNLKNGAVVATTTLPNGDPIHINFDKLGDRGVYVEFMRNGSIGTTGEGDAYRIFATVLSAIQQYVDEFKPALIRFVAMKDETESSTSKKNSISQKFQSRKNSKDVKSTDQSGESRIKLYNRMVKMLATKTGYTPSITPGIDEYSYKLAKPTNGVKEQ
jgi:hypothetical protein